MSFSTYTNMGVNEGDVVLYTCDAGYAIAGQSGNTDTATCGSGGNWDNIPTCVGKRKEKRSDSVR